MIGEVVTYYPLGATHTTGSYTSSGEHTSTTVDTSTSASSSQASAYDSFLTTQNGQTGITIVVGNTPYFVAQKGSSRSGKVSAEDLLDKWLKSYNDQQVNSVLEQNGLVHNTYRSGSYAQSAETQAAKNTVIQSLYSQALAAGKVVTLSQVLANADTAGRAFYVPEGFWYIGNNSANYATAANATAAANNITAQNTGTSQNFATSTGTSEDSDTLLWLLIPVLALVGGKWLKNRNSNKKRK
ncbi:MAG: hypothetical protein IIU66_04865 [Clostridia bacterium]|nr:hypothetical protein [Clostridia bacterium]